MATVNFKRPNEPSQKSKMPKHKKRSRLLLVALVVSLILNAYLLANA